MKKLHLLLLSITLCVFSACHNDIWDAIDGLDSRVTKLEELCKEMNTNITSLQTIVDVLQSNDFITSIVEIKKDGKVVGYTITFGKHDPITIYHGQDGKDGADGKDGQDGTNGKDGQDGADGKDGQNGADGKDGSTPVIGVAQDTDGVYYWTLNGEWLLDDNGNKLPVSGKDGQNGSNGSNGQDGADGKDGKDGADGQDGKDGITPQLKIEDGYWFISYNNGATWTQLGKATGEDGKDGVDGEDGKDGQNGADGKDGQDGDSMFQSVTQDESYVYFTLADGTVIKIAKGSSSDQPNTEFIFTITYDSNGGEGVMAPDTFYYGLNMTKTLTCHYTKDKYYLTEWNTKSNGSGVSYPLGCVISIDKNITLYAQWKKCLGNPSEYVDLGLSVKWATCNVGASKPEEYGDYFAWGENHPKSTYNWSTYKWCDGSETTLTKYNSNSSNGIVDNKRTLELDDDAARVNWGGSWRIPTSQELEELRTECTWILTTQNGVKGYNVTSKNNGNSIFLPAAGYHYHGGIDYAGTFFFCWSNSLSDSNSATHLYTTNPPIVVNWGPRSRYYGLSVRPVCH